MWMFDAWLFRLISRRRVIYSKTFFDFIIVWVCLFSISEVNGSILTKEIFLWYRVASCQLFFSRLYLRGEIFPRRAWVLSFEHKFYKLIWNIGSEPSLWTMSMNSPHNIAHNHNNEKEYWFSQWRKQLRQQQSLVYDRKSGEQSIADCFERQ